MRRERLLLGAALAAVLLLALPILTYPLGRDQGEFATIARGLLDGRVPYRDLWNPKPPAVFLVYAAALLPDRAGGPLRALDLLLYAAVGSALYAVGRRLASPAAGLWAALVFGVFYFTESFWTLTQNDGLALLPMTLAAVCAVRLLPAGDRPQPPGTQRRLGWAALAGAWCAAAVWFKYPFALFGLALAAGYALARRGAGDAWRAAWAEAAAFAAGGLAVGAAGLAWVAAAGALPDLVESARVTSQYTALTFNRDDLPALMTTALGFRWAQWGLLAILAAASYGLARLTPERRRPGWRLVNLWLVAGAAMMLVQAKGYDYHWLPLLPPLALLAGDGLARAVQTLTWRLTHVSPVPSRIVMAGASAVAAGGLLLALALSVWPKAWPYLTGQEDQLAYYDRFQGGEFIAGESLRVAAWLSARTTPGDSLFIWGFRPEVYVLSRLNPASRFIFHFPLVGDWYPAAWKQQTVDTLWAALPPYALVLQADYMPWVTGRDADSNTLLQEYTELNNWLMFNYERETQIGSFFIWRRKS